MIKTKDHIFKKNRRIIIFILAIFLPLLMVIIFGVDTYFKRQKITHDLLKSNLLLTGNSALNDIEKQLIAIEKRYFTDSVCYKLADENFKNDLFLNDTVFNLRKTLDFFLFDNYYNLIYPQYPVSPLYYSNSVDSEAEFERNIERAERSEFSDKNYQKALSNYIAALKKAITQQDSAIAIEGIARSCFSMGKDKMAVENYQKLMTGYANINNRSGHPYGIISAIRLVEICESDNKTQMKENLFEVYNKLRSGFWEMNLSSCLFLKSEIENQLETGLPENTREEFNLLKNQQTAFEKKLFLAEFLSKNIAGSLKGNVLLPGSYPENPQRYFFKTGESNIVISLVELKNFINTRTYFSGLVWDIDGLKKYFLPEVLNRLSNATGFDIFLVSDEGENVLDSQKLPGNKDQLTLPFQFFPVHWNLLVSIPEDNKIQSGFKTQIIIYAVLFCLILFLLAFGVYLISRDMNREAESMKLKTRFVHNVSHELKTPLSLIRLYGETLLIKDNLPLNEKNYALNIITKESERLSHMINNILDFSKIEIGSKEFNFKKGNLSVVARNTLESYQYHLEKNGFKIVTDFEKNLPAVFFDKEAVEGVIVNLLSNSIKYSPDVKEVHVRLNTVKDFLALSISDKGIGIHKKEQANIFQRFYRSKHESSIEARGSGLGLTIVKHIIEAHNGRIEVESSPGKGSTFTLFFPVYENRNETHERKNIHN